jgi:hypothetical protein
MTEENRSFRLPTEADLNRVRCGAELAFSRVDGASMHIGYLDGRPLVVVSKMEDGQVRYGEVQIFSRTLADPQRYAITSAATKGFRLVHPAPNDTQRL